MSSDVVASVFDITGAYLASCVLAVNSHRLRVQAVDPSASTSGNSLASSYTLDKSLKVMSLSWGVFNDALTTKVEDQYIAVCLNNGDILIYSPVQNEVIHTLKSQTGAALLSFYHSKLTGTAFSVDIAGTISEWDLINYKLLRHFKIPELSSNNNEQLSQLLTVLYENKVHLLVASYSVILIDLDDLDHVKLKFPGHVTAIHSLLSVSEDLFLTAAHNDRFVNIYSISKNNIEKVLVANSNVVSVTYGEYESKKVVVAVTEDDVELFNDPLLVAQLSGVISKKKKVKSRSKTSDAVISIARPLPNPTNEVLKINSTFLLQNKLIVSWLENSNIPFFDTLVWYDDEEGYKYSGNFKLTKEKPVIKLNDHSLYGHDVASSKQYNEGNAIVQTGDNFKDLEDEEDEESLAEKLSKLNVPTAPQPKEKKKKATAGTLTTVLTQAIKSNDHSLLETVLNNKDEEVIKNTVKRLSTSYVIPLLNRISERIARNSSKQSSMNVWIKWLFIIHGGFLNNYSNLTKNLGILHTTLHRRSLTLGRLLELNGKIDMVLENMELKKMILKSSANNEFGGEDSENESDVEYIEELEDNGLQIVDGEEDDYDDDSDLEAMDSDDEEEEGEIVEEEEEDDDEDNYSDEEIGVKKLNSDLDEELEEELALKRKIKLMKNGSK